MRSNVLFAIFIEIPDAESPKSINEAWSKLIQENFFLPLIGWGYASSLSDSVFRITYSFHQGIYALSDIEAVLRQLAMAYPLPASGVGVREALNLVNNGNAALLMNGDYNSVLFFYDKAYYLSIHFGQPPLQTALINAAINIIYIHYIEANIPNNIMQLMANLSGFVESDDFHDQFLRYDIYFLYANVLWLTEHYEEALIYCEKSVDDVRNAGAPELIMLALHNIVDAYSSLNKSIAQNYIATLHLMHEITPFPEHKNLLADILLAIKDIPNR